MNAARAPEALAVRIRASGIDAAAPLLVSGSLARDRLALELHPDRLAHELGIAPGDLDPAIVSVDAPFTARRRGVETRLVIGDSVPEPDPVLIRTLAEARRWAKVLRAGTRLRDLARCEGRAASYIRTRLPLAHLAPDLQQAILDGTLPPRVTRRWLLLRPLPLAWDAQRQLIRG